MQSKKEYWSEQLSDYHPGGVESLKDYCAARNLSYCRAKYWRHYFLTSSVAESDTSGMETGRLTFDVIPVASLAPAFAPAAAPSSSSGVTLSAGDVGIGLAPGFDADTLRRALEVLSAQREA